MLAIHRSLELAIHRLIHTEASIGISLPEFHRASIARAAKFGTVRSCSVSHLTCRCSSGRFVLVRLDGFRDAEVAGSNPAFLTNLFPVQGTF